MLYFDIFKATVTVVPSTIVTDEQCCYVTGRQLINLQLVSVSQLLRLHAFSTTDKETMIYDSGKMVVLDKLLSNLKLEGHRVLIYSQMTRVIDLLEEFMACRRYKYIRLDGSSKISDRRDMVADFQSK